MNGVMSIGDQRRRALRIAELAEELLRGGDPLLAGHLVHLRERAEAIAVILETSDEEVR